MINDLFGHPIVQNIQCIEKDQGGVVRHFFHCNQWVPQLIATKENRSKPSPDILSIRGPTRWYMFAILPLYPVKYPHHIISSYIPIIFPTNHSSSLYPHHISIPI